MGTYSQRSRRQHFSLFLLTICLLSSASLSIAQPGLSEHKARIIEHWNAERRQNAIPRDLFLDHQGRSFMADGQGGHDSYGAIQASRAEPQANPGNSGDSQGPLITNMAPTEGSTIGSSATFSADATDTSGVRAVTFVMRYPSGNTQSFAGNNTTGNTWSVSLQGFTEGTWSWWVEAKDSTRGGGNLSVSNSLNFNVSIGSEPPPPSAEGVIPNAPWTFGGAVQTAAGRIYFEMPSNAKRKGPWNGYVCSGTVIEDTANDRAIILTAAHCLYDDINKSFARNVLFIPNQAGTSGSSTDSNCNNDPLGCWLPDFAVVDQHWTTRTFPDNIPWDYGYYVVSDQGAHQGNGAEALQSAAGFLPISFNPPFVNDSDPSPNSLDYTHALGYSYSDDPYFMYCAEDMTTEGSANWWLPSCGLSGGSSGGPWIQPLSNGSGPIISVNSWGYTSRPGMAGPYLHNTSAQCLYIMANSTAFNAISNQTGDAGLIVSCP